MLSLDYSKEQIETKINTHENTKITHILEKFELFKENLKERKNFYINYFFYFFGDHYESIINSVNFFHYATESILLEILKKKNPEVLLNSRGPELFEYMKGLRIDYQKYYDNIKLLTGSCYFYDMATKISEMKIASLFLQKFNFYNEKEIENLSNEKENLNFESLFLSITQKATSSVLYDLNPIQLNNEELKETFDSELIFFYCFYEAKNKNLILINFIKSIQNKSDVNLKILNDNKLMNIVKMFYFFSKTKFEDFMLDLELFGDYSTSLYEKIKKISIKNYEMLNSNFKKSLRKTLPYENLKSFYNIISYKLTDSAVIVKSKIMSFKLWINDSIKNCPNFFYEKFKVSQIFIYDKVLQPSKNFLVLYTNKYTTLLFTNIKNVKKVSSEISNFFLEKAETFMNNLENKVNEKELFIKFTADEQTNFVKVDLDNTVLMINPKRLKFFIDDLYNQIRQYSLDILEKSKSFIFSRYKLFLGEEEKKLAEE